MGRKDVITKEYMEDTEVFADVFNHMIYKGEKVIDPKNLKELDTANVIIPYGADGAEVPYQKYRDVFKILCAIQCSLCNASEKYGLRFAGVCSAGAESRDFS